MLAVSRLFETGGRHAEAREHHHDDARTGPFQGDSSRCRSRFGGLARFGPTLACEKLRERHGIDLAKETVRRIMIDAGFWVPRKLRPAKVHQPRNRRACLGELVQIDGSDHAWFEDRAPACTLLVYVDDATSRLMQLLFVPTESTQAYFTATQAYVERHGKPQAFYSDKAGVFRINARENAEGRGYTQFGRALFAEPAGEGIAPARDLEHGSRERLRPHLRGRLQRAIRQGAALAGSNRGRMALPYPTRPMTGSRRLTKA